MFHSSMKELKRTAFIIDSNGKELPLGRYTMVCDIKYGWMHACNVFQDENNTRFFDEYFISLDGNEKLKFHGRRHSIAQHSPLLDVIYYPMDYEDCHRGGVWSMKEDRPVLSESYKSIYGYAANERVFPVQDLNNRLQLRGDGDQLLADFGVLNGEAHLHNRLEDAAHPLLIISKGFKDKNRYCIDLWTGLRIGPEFITIGNLNEGMRYMRSTDDRHYMVDADWIILFELPHPPCISHPGWGEDEKLTSYANTERFVCRDGMIAIEGERSSCLIDREGRIIIPPGKSKYIFTVGENRLLLSKGTKVALAEADGTPLTEYDYRTCWGSIRGDFDQFFHDGRLAIMKKVTKKGDPKNGYLSPEGKEVIPFIYGHGDDFSDGYASVRMKALIDE